MRRVLFRGEEDREVGLELKACFLKNMVVGGRRSGGWVWGQMTFLMEAFLNSQRNNRVVIIAALDVDVMTTF